MRLVSALIVRALQHAAAVQAAQTAAPMKSAIVTRFA
jgi:hypothetical protein